MTVETLENTTILDNDATEPEANLEDTVQEATESPESDAETFPREYVEKLRAEAAEARVRVKDRDTLAQALFTARVAALGQLADPADLPYDEALLNDPDGLTAAVAALLDSKPHLAVRRPRGNIGQGLSEASATVDLAGLLRASAG